MEPRDRSASTGCVPAGHPAVDSGLHLELEVPDRVTTTDRVPVTVTARNDGDQALALSRSVYALPVDDDGAVLVDLVSSLAAVAPVRLEPGQTETMRGSLVLYACGAETEGSASPPVLDDGRYHVAAFVNVDSGQPLVSPPVTVEVAFNG